MKNHHTTCIKETGVFSRRLQDDGLRTKKPSIYCALNHKKDERHQHEARSHEHPTISAWAKPRSCLHKIFASCCASTSFSIPKSSLVAGYELTSEAEELNVQSGQISTPSLCQPPTGEAAPPACFGAEQRRSSISKEARRMPQIWCRLPSQMRSLAATGSRCSWKGVLFRLGWAVESSSCCGGGAAPPPHGFFRAGATEPVPCVRTDPSGSSDSGRGTRCFWRRARASTTATATQVGL